MPEQKSVTFFIGNGFDLNLGLKTSYGEFVDWYADENLNENKLYSIPKNNEFEEEIKFFRRELKEKIKNDHTWADLELALGKATDWELFRDNKNSLSSKGESVFRACKYDLEMNLSYYLSKQDQRFRSVLSKKGDLSCTYAKMIMEKMYKHWKSETPQEERKKIKAALKHYYDTFEFKLVSFNYTSVVTTLFKEIIPLFRVARSLFLDCDYSGDYPQGDLCVPIHGILNKPLAFGVDNVDQISNVHLRKSKQFQDFFLKPTMTSVRGINTNEKVRNIIDSSAVLCIYGMSIGETDKTWWKIIGDELSKDPERILVIYHYTLQRTDHFEINNALKEEVKRAFCDIADIPQEKLDAVCAQIIVILNTNLFTFKNLREEINGNRTEETIEEVAGVVE